jgi:hypothetical protein
MVNPCIAALYTVVSFLVLLYVYDTLATWRALYLETRAHLTRESELNVFPFQHPSADEILRHSIESVGVCILAQRSGLLLRAALRRQWRVSLDYAKVLLYAAYPEQPGPWYRFCRAHCVPTHEIACSGSTQWYWLVRRVLEACIADADGPCLYHAANLTGVDVARLLARSWGAEHLAERLRETRCHDARLVEWATRTVPGEAWRFDPAGECDKPCRGDQRVVMITDTPLADTQQ